MRLSRLFLIIIVVSFLTPLCLVNTTSAQDNLESRVDATFNINFLTATELNLDVSMDVSEITLISGSVYTGTEIQALANTDSEMLPVIKYALKLILTDQIEQTFEKATVTTLNEIPSYADGKFNDDFNVNLTSEFFGMNETVNAHNFFNGVLDMGAKVAYAFNLKAESGWNNTYTIILPTSMNRTYTNGKVLEKRVVSWELKNGDGLSPGKVADITVERVNPTTPRSNTEDILLEFELDAGDAEHINLKTNVLAKSVDIGGYNILPNFVTNLDFVTSDGIRLFIENGLTSWDDLYQKTIKPVEINATSTIESSLNQTLNMVFSWDPETTTNCSTPYDITNMNEEPPIKAGLLASDISLKIDNIRARAIFGLIDAGATANISASNVNFGDKLSEIGYPYSGSFYLPDNISLAGEKIYKWNQSKSISGEFKSEDAPKYSNEKINAVIEIDFSGLDLNLFGLFTGKTELISKLYMKEANNYYVTTLPNEFNGDLPNKVILNYLNSDAFRLCVEENVFKQEKISTFLDNEKLLFENRLTNILPGLKISGLVKRDDFDRSLVWDGDITNMDADTPVTTASDAHSSYPVTFGISFSPPKFEITEQSLNLVGLQNQNVTYRIVLPRGTTMDASDSLNRLVPGKTTDGRDYIEISFDASESNLTDVVRFKIVPSPLFALSIFLPCIVCLIIAVVLIIAILIIRKKRRGFGGKKTRPKKTKESKEDEEEESGGYEEQEYYVPPPPSSKK